jgi:hypothetical protein
LRKIPFHLIFYHARLYSRLRIDFSFSIIYRRDIRGRNRVDLAKAADQLKTIYAKLDDALNICFEAFVPVVDDLVFEIQAAKSLDDVAYRHTCKKIVSKLRKQLYAPDKARVKRSVLIADVLMRCVFGKDFHRYFGEQAYMSTYEMVCRKYLKTRRVDGREEMVDRKLARLLLDIIQVGWCRPTIMCRRL